MPNASEHMPDLVAAIRAGDGDRVSSLLERHPELVSMHDPDSFGATAMMHAVGCDDKAVVDLLLDAGANVDQRSDWWAGSFGVLDQCSDDMAEHLLGRGATLTPHAAARLGKLGELQRMLAAEPACVHERGGDGQLPLHFSRTPEIADVLLEAGAEIDARDVDHEGTAAQWLAFSRPTVAAHLLSRGAAADPFVATATGALDVLETVVAADADGVDARVSRDRFATVGERAAEHIYFYTVGEGCSLLHAAAMADQAESIRWLIARGADPSVRSGYDQATPLHLAAWHDAPEAVHALATAGADLDAVSGDIHRNEPLGWAVVSGASAALAALLERGASVREAHREDARVGAEGKFRSFNRERPLEKWVEVRGLLGSD